MTFMESIHQTRHLSVILAITCVAIFFVAKFIKDALSPQARRLRNLPIIEEKDDLQLRKSVAEAYTKYAKVGEFYKIRDTFNELIVIPSRYMGEIKGLPQNKLSFSEEIFERFNGELTGVGRFEPSFIKTITGSLTKRIPTIMSELAEETEYAFKDIIGDSQQSTSVAMLPAAQRFITLLSSRVFVGSPLCHDESWIEAMIVHTNHTFSASERVWKYPHWLRPLIAPYMKEFKEMNNNKHEVERMLAPLISARQKAALSEDSVNDYDDILTCLIKNAPADKKADVGYHAHNQLTMSAAGIHTTAQVLTLVIYNLAAYPEYYEELREELKQVLREDGARSRTLVMDKHSLTKLVNLDSFMKETQRLNPLAIVSTLRKVTAPDGLTLSNGIHFPFGSYTAVNSYNIVNDPDLFPEPENFNGFRFSNLVASGEVKPTKFQFTTVNSEFIAFGQGPHSCPGRYFAAAEIKLVLAYILLHYDVAFENGQARPSNVTRGTLQGPNGQAKVVFTPREDSWDLVGEYE